MKLKATERELIDPGFRRAYQPLARPDAAPFVPAGSGRLAKLKKGDRVKPRQVRVQKRVLPLSVMSEAALIRAMQAHGIGRPSTYATTVETLVARGYAMRNQAGELTPTDRGRAVCVFLVHRFPGLFDTQYTARMESRLDDIARGQAAYFYVIRQFWQEIQTLLSTKSGSPNP
jgi:DNA topoisomerase-1